MVELHVVAQYFGWLLFLLVVAVLANDLLCVWKGRK